MIQQEKIEVSANRFDMGYWCHDTNRQIGEGDISAAYSADVIALEGRVRKPFRLQGWLRASVNHSRIDGVESCKCYRLVPASAFDGVALSYHAITAQGSGACRKKNGFYHGMAVKHGKQDYVLVGPPLFLVAGKPDPVQADLFG